MNFDEIMLQLEAWGSEQTKKVLVNHGAREPFFGVKVGELKKIQKKVKKDHNLALRLYATGNSDAMYLAGLIADETKMSKQDLQNWVKGAYWYMISDYTVAWIAAESNFGWELALEWIEQEDEFIQSAGWSTLSSIMGTYEDHELDLNQILLLMERVGKTIHQAKNRVRQSMNNFIIAVGTYVAPLLEDAKRIAASVGKVEVFMGKTSCKVHLATDYIQKIESMGRVGKKRKLARC